ncbi:hypothetical protein A3G16_00670 [Candidatus Curtissbacteria bacterium RIFCSPLOWO2_12_FULL_41_16]|nr:MAG: hypothetical protein A3G16_00670 [Candidatus Curtissbacteria bacterium RIFCSPLOWO2_12_FULL_41_16]
MANKSDTFWYKAIISFSLLFFLQIFAPFFKGGLFLGHDSQLHLIYLKHFEKTFKAGQIPVRIIDWFNPGYNQPLFNFYQPGVNYLYLIPRFLGVPPAQSVEVTVLALWLLSAVLMFAFTRRHFGTLGGILAAYFYLIAPYHILDIFVRSALPEFTALAFAPGIFWALKSYSDTQKGPYLTLLAFFVAATTISHPPTLIMFSPFIVGYLLYLLYQQKSFSLLWPTLLSISVGFGLISFFILPAFFEQKYVQTIYMRSGYYDFHNHFVCLPQLFIPRWEHGTSQIGCADKISFQLGIVHWLVVLMAATILIARFNVKGKVFKKTAVIDIESLKPDHYLLITICLGSIFLYLYMTLPVSLPIWENLPYIAYIQYPWRFLAPTIFLSSFLSGGVILIFKANPYRYLAFVILILSAAVAYNNYLKPIAYAQREEINFGNEILHESITGIKNLYPEPGYMPKWTQILPAETDTPENEVRVATQEAKVNSSKLSAARKEYEITVEKPTVARFYTHYFPGWQVKVDDKTQNPLIDNIYGYMDIELAPGEHQVTLSFKNTPIRSLANILSLNFLLVSLALAFLFGTKTLTGKPKSITQSSKNSLNGRI